MEINLLIQGTLTTLEIAFFSLTIGLTGGIVLGVVNCERLQIPVLSHLIHAFVAVVRGTPAFIQILIFYFALPSAFGIDLSPLVAGIAALGINSSAYVAEIVRCGINSIAPGQWEVATALGYHRVQTLQSIILPQMLRNILPALTNEMISLLKETSILMVIGVSELTKVGRDIVARELDPMTTYLTVGAIYLSITTVLSLVSRHLEGRWKK